MYAQVEFRAAELAPLLCSARGDVGPLVLLTAPAAIVTAFLRAKPDELEALAAQFSEIAAEIRAETEQVEP